jgi:hypothetical protein
LVGDLGSKEAVIAVQKDFRKAGLLDKDAEMLAYAEPIAIAASQITRQTSIGSVTSASAISRFVTSFCVLRSAVS